MNAGARPRGVAQRDDVAQQGDVVHMDALPSLARLYARAAGPAVAGLARRGAPVRAVLPSVALCVRGVRVDVSRLADYQRLVGEPVNDSVPSGYLHVLSFPLATELLSRRECTLPLMGMVHLANDASLLRAVPAGERLEFTSWVARPRAHKRGVMVDSLAQCAIDGEVVWRGCSTYLAKGVTCDGPEVEGPPRREPPDAPTGLWRLGADAGRRYAAVSGDINPIHMSVLSARALGFRRPIVHGMYSAARALAEVGSLRGDAYRWNVEFGAPVYLPATLAFTQQVATSRVEFSGWSGDRTHFAGTVSPI